ncbi:MAG: hypothetical protein FWF72_02785 [Paludibacter sp.]|nr:hypothetical protein [Paludibacter sp.]
MTVADNMKLLLLRNSVRNTLNFDCLYSHLAISNNISPVKFSDILRARFMKIMRFLFKDVQGKLAMAFLGLSVLQLSLVDVQAQNSAPNVSQGGMTVFVGDNSIISNSSAINGDFSFVYSKERKTADAEIKSDMAVVQNYENQNFDLQWQTLAASVSKNEETVFIGNNSVIFNAALINGDFSFVYSKERKTADADIKSDMAVVQNYENQNFALQWQTLAANVSKNEETVFIGNNSAIFNAALINGDFSFVYSKERKTEIAYIKPDRTLAQNSDFQQTTIEKSGVKIKKTHKETVYSPLSPFGGVAFISGCMISNAVLPVQSNHSHKLFCQNFTQIFFTTIFDFTSKYFANNNFALQSNGSFACAQGNLPPPTTTNC